MIEIPLNSSSEQLFSITLNSTNYDCRVIYNSRVGIWSISFATGGDDVVTGIAIVGGVDMVKQYNFPVRNLYTVNLQNPSHDATADNLGTGAKLFMLTDEEVPSGASV